MTDWQSWQKHVKTAVADNGTWIGLADQNWAPVMDMPPVVELSAQSLRLAPADLELSTVVRDGGAISPLVNHLIADGLGKVDERGALEVTNQPARNIIIQRGDHTTRQAYFITDTVAVGDEEAPYLLKIQGQDLLGMLDATPCPSIPRTWGQTPLSTWTEDAGGAYTKPREYGAVELADSADGFTVEGAAVPVIRELIQDSIDAVVKQMGWQTPHIVVDMGWAGAGGGKRTVIRVADRSVWETIAEPARVAGVNIRAYVWWPGDPVVLVRPSKGKAPVFKSFTHAVCVVQVSA